MSKKEDCVKTGLTIHKYLILPEIQKRKWKKKETKGNFWKLAFLGNEGGVQEILQLYKLYYFGRRNFPTAVPCSEKCRGILRENGPAALRAECSFSAHVRIF